MENDELPYGNTEKIRVKVKCVPILWVGYKGQKLTPIDFGINSKKLKKIWQIFKATNV